MLDHVNIGVSEDAASKAFFVGALDRTRGFMPSRSPAESRGPLVPHG